MSYRTKLYRKVFLSLLFHPTNWMCEEKFEDGELELVHINTDVMLTRNTGNKFIKVWEGDTTVTKQIGRYFYWSIDENTYMQYVSVKGLFWRVAYYLLAKRVQRRIDNDINDDQARGILEDMKRRW